MDNPDLPDWMKALYDDVFADVMLDREPSGDEIRFLVDTLHLSPGSRVLDQGCGLGCMAIPLARLGIQVIGIDVIPSYVARASGKARSEGLPARFLAADACSWVASEPLDAAFSWWTSWGHAGTDASNLAMLRRVFESLRPGGTFAMDTMNVPSILRDFAPVTIRHRDVPVRRGRVEIRRECGLDFAAGEISTIWRFLMPDGREIATPTVMRMYMPHDVVGMLRAAGFADIRVYGGIEGEPLSMDSRRLVALAVRP